MKKGKKLKKILIICFSILAALIVLPLAFVGIVTISSNNRSLDVDRNKTIENNTGLVQQKGKALYDKDGKYLLLRGVNAGNLLVSEGWLSPYSVGEAKDDSGNIVYDDNNLPTYPELPMEETVSGFEANPNLTDKQRKELIDIYRKNWFAESDFAFIKNDLQMNMIRLPFYWRDILVEENGKYARRSEEDAFGYIDSFLENCKKYNLYCILDLHGAPGSQNGYEHCGDMTQASIWSNETYQNATIDLWKYIAEHYSTTKSDLAPTIAAYDLMNEPCTNYNDKNAGTSVSIAYPFFDKIYKAIRGVNDNHVICIEGVWSFNCFDDPANWGWENILYQTHLYNWNHSWMPYWLYTSKLTKNSLFFHTWIIEIAKHRYLRRR